MSASSAGDVHIPTQLVTLDESVFDVAVLRADLKAGYFVEGGVAIDAGSLLATAPNLPLRVGLVGHDGEKGTFLGYRREEADGTGQLIFDVGGVGVRQAPNIEPNTLLELLRASDIIAEGEVFDGHSGSPLIDESGYVFAVVTDYEVPRRQELDFYQLNEDLKRRRIRATPMLLASWLLDEALPMTAEAERVARQIKGKTTVSSIEEAVVTHTVLEPLSWLTLTSEIMHTPKAYLPALSASKRIVYKLHQEQLKHCILARADPWRDFLTANGIDPSGLSLTDLYEEFRRMRELDADDAELRGFLGPAIDAYRLELARNLGSGFEVVQRPDGELEIAEGTAEVTELSRSARARLNRELAELQLAALQAGSDQVSVDDVKESLVAALSTGRADPVTYRTAAAAAFVEENYELALGSLALARQASSSEAFARSVEEDYERIASQYLADRAGEVRDFDFGSLAAQTHARGAYRTQDLVGMVVKEAAGEAAQQAVGRM